MDEGICRYEGSAVLLLLLVVFFREPDSAGGTTLADDGAWLWGLLDDMEEDEEG